MNGNARENDAEAARWALRLDADSPLSPSEQNAFDQWLSAEPLRSGALLRARAALSYLDRGRALKEVLPRPAPRRLWTRRRVLIGGASAGALAAAVGAFSVGLWHSRRYSTDLGEVRRVPLPDGSVATLNTRSIIEMSLERHARQIELAQGEVWFQVSKDKVRPFVVSAGRVRVQAVGTAFSVRRRESGADIVVTEGVVDVWLDGAAASRRRVEAGSMVGVDASDVHTTSVKPSRVERSLAWREGEIALEGETLGEAAAEFNRYNNRRLVIEDPVLARERLVGQFRTTDPEAFARAAASTLGAQVSISESTLTLTRGGSP